MGCDCKRSCHLLRIFNKMASFASTLSCVRHMSTSSAASQLVKAPVQLFTLEGRYATALYSAASKKKAISSVLSKSKASPLTINLFSPMAENGRLQKLSQVVESFETIMAAERGEVICEVTTAKALSAAQLKE